MDGRPSPDGGPDVAKDGSIRRDDEESIEEPGSERRKLERLRYSLEVSWLRQRSNAWTLVQLSGFASFLFGAFRLFGIGVLGTDGLGPLSREFFTTVYLPGPWTTWNPVWEFPRI
jgi:hypothetical protein